MARICIDGFNLGMPKGSGIATYTRNLLGSLSALGHETQILYASARGQHPDNLLNLVDLVDAPPAGERFTRLRMLCRSVRPVKTVRAWPVDMVDDVVMHEVEARFPPADRIWAAQDIFHSANRSHAALQRFTSLHLGKDLQTDIMHWTCVLPLNEPRTRNVYTIHDLIPLRLPYTTLENKRNFYDLCRTICEKADTVFTVSENSKRDIVRLLKIPESRVINTYQSAEIPAHLLEISDADVGALLSSTFGLEWKGFYLYFGALEPKKNIGRMVEAYLGSGTSAPLVIVGGRAWLENDHKDLLYSELTEATVFRDGMLKRADRIRQYNYVPFRLLVNLIRGARATLFPSLYEGFGLPVLESMLLGTAVLTSGAGSLPEIADDAAIIVDPYDVEAIRKGIQALDADEGLRAELVRRGSRQAAKFSPSAYRERLRDAYEALV